MLKAYINLRQDFRSRNEKDMVWILRQVNGLLYRLNSHLLQIYRQKMQKLAEENLKK